MLFSLLYMIVSVILFISCCEGGEPEVNASGRIKFVDGPYFEYPSIYLYIIEVDGREYIISDEGYMFPIEKGGR